MLSIFQRERSCGEIVYHIIVCCVQNRSLLSEQPFLPDVLPSLCDTFVSKKIIATPMKIGFLGLGLIGSGAVDSLLRSGHEVTIWNRTASKVIEYFLSFQLAVIR